MSPKMTGLLKHQVFVSSTFVDLQAERQAAVQAILQAGHIPAGMELFAAEDRSQMQVIQAWINESDIYMLILGSRYGSVDPASGQSYTEVEYRYALENGKAVFALVLSDDAINEKHRVMGAKASDNPMALKEFRSFVMTKVVRVVSSLDQVKLGVLESLQTLTRNRTLGGWTRIESGGPDLTGEMARLSAENAELRTALSKAPQGSLSVKQWRAMLLGRSYRAPKEGESITLLDAFQTYSASLGRGVESTGGWMYTIAGALLALGLAEYAHVPAGAHYKRITISERGQRLHTLLLAGTSMDSVIIE